MHFNLHYRIATTRVTSEKKQLEKTTAGRMISRKHNIGPFRRASAAKRTKVRLRGRRVEFCFFIISLTRYWQEIKERERESGYTSGEPGLFEMSVALTAVVHKFNFFWPPLSECDILANDLTSSFFIICCFMYGILLYCIVRAVDPRIQREKQREREAKIAAKENKVNLIFV